MRAQRERDTGTERALRSALHARGLRFRKDYLVPVHGGRATRVDIAFTRARLVVLVDGCFWHGCPKHGRVPSANPQYWPDKLKRNRERDRLVTASLERDGWVVVRLWEHLPLRQAVETVESAVRAALGVRVG